MKRFVTFTISILTLIMVLVSCGSSDESKGTIKIGTPDANGELQGIEGIAQANGYYKEELEKIGYDFEVVGFAGAGPAVNEALISGSLDFASYADVPGIVLASKSEDVALLASSNEEIHCVIMVKKDSNIKTIEDLKSKKVAFTKGTYMHRYVIAILQEFGLSQADLSFIQMGGNELESALFGDSVDAIATTEYSAYRMLEKSDELTFLHSTREKKELSGSQVIVGLKSTLTDKPGVAEAINKANERAKEFSIEHTEEAYEILAELSKSTKEIQEKIFQFDNQAPYTFSITSGELEKLETVKQFLLENELINNDFSISEWANQ